MSGEECPNCGGYQPMTVRMLIHELIETATSLDSIVEVCTENGGVTVSFAIGGVDEVAEPDDEFPGLIALYAGASEAWSTETGKPTAGVLMLDGMSE